MRHIPGLEFETRLFWKSQPLGWAQERKRSLSLSSRAFCGALLLILAIGWVGLGQNWEVIGQNVSDVILGRDMVNNAPLVFAVDSSSGDIKSYNLATKAWSRVGGPGAEFVVAETGTLFGITVDRRVLVEHVSGSNWAWIREGTKDVIGSQGGVYAIDGASGDILMHDSSGGWTRIGGPGTQFVAGAGTCLYALAMDGSTAFRYEGAPNRWTKIGQGFKQLLAGGTKLFGIQASSGDIYEFSGTPMSWTKIGGPGKDFAADYDGHLYGLSVDGAAVFSYSGTPNSWSRIEGGPATSIEAGGGRLCVIDARGQLSMYTPAESESVPLTLITMPPTGTVTTPVPPATTVPLTTPPIATTTTPLPPEVVTAYLGIGSQVERVIRAQILLMTADVSSAGTDDPVKVMLNNGNETWLNYGRDDFERGDTFTYDLRLKFLGDLDDIGHLEISKTGSDGWCISYLALLINGKVIYDRAFSPGHWLDNSDGHSRTLTIPGSELRTHSNWANREPFSPALPYIISRAELESRIEAIVGHLLHSEEDLYWEDDKKKWVEVYPVDADTFEVDLDLQAVDGTPLADPWVDVNFDVHLSCFDGRLTLQTGEPRWRVKGGFLVFVRNLQFWPLFVTDAITENLVEEFLADFEFYTSTYDGDYCPPFWVNEHGDVVIGD